MKRLTKQLMTMLLSLALVIAMLPVMDHPAYAASGWTKASSLEFTRSSDTDCAINKVTFRTSGDALQVTATADDISALLDDLELQSGYLIWELYVNGTSFQENCNVTGTGKSVSYTFTKKVQPGDKIQVGLGYGDDAHRIDPTVTEAKIIVPSDPDRIEAKYGYNSDGEYYENEVSFGKTYTGHKAGYVATHDAGTYKDSYYLTVSNLDKDSVIRIEAAGTYRIRIGDVNSKTEITAPYEFLWPKSNGKLYILVDASDKRSMKITKENYSYGNVSSSWVSSSLTGGKVVKGKKSTLKLAYTNGRNFGSTNTGGHIIDVSAKSGKTSITRSGSNVSCSYTGSRIGRDTITVKYGDGSNRAVTTKKITVDVCPAKPSKPSRITGATKSIRIYHTSACKNWMLQRYKDGKWVNVCKSKNGTTASSMSVTGLKANKSYKFRIYDLKVASSTVPMLKSPVSAAFTVKTASSTKPVIRSVKISNVKNTYHEKQWNEGYWCGDTYIKGRYTEPYWTTSFKVTVNMKKTITGSYGRTVAIKMSKKSTLKKVLKGNKTAYSYTVTVLGKHKASEFKGKSATVKACTDSAGLIVGPASSAVKTK